MFYETKEIKKFVRQSNKTTRATSKPVANVYNLNIILYI